MSIAILTTGDDSQIPVQLYKVSNGVYNKFNINGSAVIKASVVSLNHKNILVAPVVVVDDTLGDDWADSLIKVKFTEADTVDIKDRQLGTAILEIQVDESVSGGGKTTWNIPIKLRKGTIDQ